MQRALDSDDRRLSLSVWWLLQLSWRFDHAVHGSWDRLRWTRAADSRRTASISPRDERQLDWLAPEYLSPEEAQKARFWDECQAALVEREQAGTITPWQAEAARAWFRGREALHGEDSEDAPEVGHAG